jgi:hypothetical protein
MKFLFNPIRHFICGMMEARSQPVSLKFSHIKTLNKCLTPTLNHATTYIDQKEEEEKKTQTRTQ